MPDSAASSTLSGGRFFGSRKRRPSAPASKTRNPFPAPLTGAAIAPSGPDSSSTAQTATASSHSHRRQSSRHSIAASVSGLGSSLRRSNSVEGSHKARRPSTAATALESPVKPQAADSASHRDTTSGHHRKASFSAAEPKTPLAMLAVPFGGSRKEDKEAVRQASASYASNAQVNGNHVPPPVPPPTGGSQTPFAIYQHIHDTASKRISTLDYLRKAYVLPSNPHLNAV